MKTLIRVVLHIENKIRARKGTPNRRRDTWENKTEHVAKFHNYSDLELVRKTPFDKNQDLRTLRKGFGNKKSKATLEKT